MTSYNSFTHRLDSGISARVAYSLFTPRRGAPAECHAMIQPDGGSSFEVQLEAVMAALAALRASLGHDAEPVFARFFLSDPVNQAPILAPGLDCAVSVVGQSPLCQGLPKLVLWIYLREEASVTRLPGGASVAHMPGDVSEIWEGGVCRPGLDPHEATAAMLRGCSAMLRDCGASLAANCMRTWFFVRDVDMNYAGVVSGRNEVFADEGLTPHTHFIASTGIGGSNPHEKCFVSFDSYSVKGLAPDDVTYLYGSTHLNPTYEYGVAFERAVALCFPDRTHALVSGTASIDNKGSIMYPGDIERQTLRMCENVEVLLAEGGFAPADMAHAIVYVRDTADASAVTSIIENKYPGLPFTVVLAPVCRPGWLVEMECIAAR